MFFDLTYWPRYLELRPRSVSSLPSFCSSCLDFFESMKLVRKIHEGPMFNKSIPPCMHLELLQPHSPVDEWLLDFRLSISQQNL